MSDTAISRVHYFDRQFLRTQDFTDEQHYHVAMRRRHNIAQHSWGIVAGLELTVDAESRLSVGPGMAIDGYGRELILPERQPIPTDAFDDRDTDVLGVWLIYDRVLSDLAPDGYNGCGTDGSTAGYRWRELARVRTDIVDPSRTDMRRPLSVPTGDLTPDPTRTPPDDPTEDWPVFLGEIRRQRARPQDPYTYQLFEGDAARPYAGLVGERIVAASGRAEVQIGAEDPNDSRRFAVFVQSTSTDPDLRDLAALEIDRDGKTHLAGATTIHDQLTIQGGAIELNPADIEEVNSDGQRIAPPVLPARPWQLYHYLVLNDSPAEATPASGEGNGKQALSHELRIEIGGRGTGTNTVVIGAWSPDAKEFVPSLTVADNRQVTVHGNLVIQGTLKETKTRPAPQLSPQYKALALSASISAINAAIREQVFTSADVQAVLRSPEGRHNAAGALLNEQSWLEGFTKELAANNTGQRTMGRSILSHDGGTTIIAELLAGNTDWLDRTATALVQRPSGQEVLITVLLGNDLARTMAVTRLLSNAGWRQTLVEGLVANEDGRRAMVSELLNRDNGRESLISFLLVGDSDSTTALQAIISRLIGEQGGREAIIERLLANADARQLVVTRLLSSDGGREATIAFLVDSANGAVLRLVLSGLLGSSQGQQAFVQVLQENGTALSAIFTSLAGNVAARATLVTTMLGDPTTRQAMIEAIWLNDTARDALFGYLLSTVDRADSVVARVIDQGVGTEALKRALLGAGEGGQLAIQVLNGLLLAESGRQQVIDGVKGQAENLSNLLFLALKNDVGSGPRAMATALRAAPDDRYRAFINVLKSDEFSALADKLRNDLK